MCLCALLQFAVLHCDFLSFCIPSYPNGWTRTFQCVNILHSPALNLFFMVSVYSSIAQYFSILKIVWRALQWLFFLSLVTCCFFTRARNVHIHSNRCVSIRSTKNAHMHARTSKLTALVYLLSKTQSDRMHLTISVCSKTWNKFQVSYGCWCLCMCACVRACVLLAGWIY